MAGGGRRGEGIRKVRPEGNIRDGHPRAEGPGRNRCGRGVPVGASLTDHTAGGVRDVDRVGGRRAPVSGLIAPFRPDGPGATATRE